MNQDVHKMTTMKPGILGSLQEIKRFLKNFLLQSISDEEYSLKSMKQYYTPCYVLTLT